MDYGIANDCYLSLNPVWIWVPAGAWTIDALDLKPSDGLVSLSSTPTYMRPSSNLAEKLTKNENSKFKL